jgi:protein-S-isoprenylcysteine O-methyltransferase Ste14
LFLGAGRWNWAGGWRHLIALIVITLFNPPIIRAKNPELMRIRQDFRVRAFKGPDRWFVMFHMPLTTLTILVGALDTGRFGWTHVPLSLIVFGLVLYFLSDIQILATMLANPHAEQTVRIQTDRAHRVITTGPYRFVRHPMYVGTSLMILSIPLILGSLWAFIPAALDVLVLIARTAWEDNLLHRELEGYAAYAEVTRYRLFPGIW